MFEKPEQTDIAIIGAGPAGVAAAVTAARAGAQVTLLDESPRAGGQYYKQPVLNAKDNQFPPAVAENIRKGRKLLSDLQHKISLFSTVLWFGMYCRKSEFSTCLVHKAQKTCRHSAS